MHVVNRNEARSVDGNFAVQQIASFTPTFLYREGDHVLEFGGERMTEAGKYTTLIFLTSSSAWEPPHNAEPIDDERKAQIVQRIAEALTALDHNPTFFAG